MIPDTVIVRFERPITAGAWDVVRHYAGRFEADDLLSEAWIIATDRWPVWLKPGKRNPEGFARTDIRLQLLNRTRQMLKADGDDVLIDPDGLRRKPKPEEPDEDVPMALALDWPTLARGQWLQFARLILDSYPEVASAFEEVDQAQKPRNRTKTEWSRMQENKRAQLRVRFAQELAMARYLVEGHEAGGFELAVAA